MLRPLEDAMKYLKDFPRHGYDPIYEATEEEISDIWEERRPIEGFKFNVEPIAYLKKMGTGWWRSKTRTSSCIFQKNSGGIMRFNQKILLKIQSSQKVVFLMTGIILHFTWFTAEIKERTEVPEFTQKKINSRSKQKLGFEIPKAEFFERIA